MVVTVGVSFRPSALLVLVANLGLRGSPVRTAGERFYVRTPATAQWHHLVPPPPFTKLRRGFRKRQKPTSAVGP